MADVSKQEHGTELSVTEHSEERDQHPEAINVYSHSNLFYWWPVWVIGFVMAFITYNFGETISLNGSPEEKIHLSSSLGLIYVFVFFAILLITNLPLRGVVAGTVIMTGLFLAVLFAWLGWWDDIVRMVPELSIHMNFGFYILSSTLIFILWALTFFVFDRLSYWRFVPGQVTHEHIIGGAEQSYDTSGLMFEEFHDDPFRHWVIGFGTGDLKMTIKNKEFNIPNVVWAHDKVTKIQKLIKIKPD